MNIEEIRAVRVAEAEKTINMTTKEIVEYSKSKGGDLLARVRESQKQKKAVK